MTRQHPAGDPPQSLGTRATATGIVKWFRSEKGYGCIESKQTAPWDIWVHFSAIETEGYKNLEEGEPVEVDYERANQDSFRYRATRVRSLGSKDP